MIKSPHVLILILGLFTLNCATHRVSVVEGCNYDQTKNQTDYFVIPYGSVSLLGKWKKVNYNAVSKQQFFENSDSIKWNISNFSISYSDKWTENVKLDFLRALYLNNKATDF